MTFSKWNHALKRYDYYEAPGAAPHTPTPDFLKGQKNDVGIVAGWPIPANARPAGSGQEARGFLSGDEGSSGSNMGVVLGLGAAAFLWWKFFGKGRAR